MNSTAPRCRHAKNLGAFYVDSQRIEVLRGLQHFASGYPGGFRNESDCIGACVLAHELAGHFWPHISSPYGFHLWRLHTVRVGVVGELLQRLRDDARYHGPIRLPLHEWCARTANAPVRRLLDFYFEIWDCLSRHAQHIEGGFALGGQTFGEVAHDWTRVLQLICAAHEIDPSFIKDNAIGTCATVEAPASPRLTLPTTQTFSGGTYGLGARAISEGFALGQEADFLWHAGGSNHDLKPIADRVSDRRWSEADVEPYKLIWGYVAQVAAGDCQLGTWVAALADLAMCGAIDVHQMLRRPAPHQWEDIHPGWRFARATVAAKELGLLTGPESVRPGRPFDYRAVIGAICERLKWTPPWELWESARYLSLSMPRLDGKNVTVLSILEPERGAPFPTDNRPHVVHYYKMGAMIRERFPDAMALPFANMLYTSILLDRLSPFHVWQQETDSAVSLEPPVPPEVLGPLFEALDQRQGWATDVATLPGAHAFDGENAKACLYFSAAVNIAGQIMEEKAISLLPPENAYRDRVLKLSFGLEPDEIERIAP